MPDTFWQRVSALAADLREDGNIFETSARQLPQEFIAGAAGVLCGISKLEYILTETEETHKHLRPKESNQTLLTELMEVVRPYIQTTNDVSRIRRLFATMLDGYVGGHTVVND